MDPRQSSRFLAEQDASDIPLYKNCEELIYIILYLAAPLCGRPYLFFFFFIGGQARQASTELTGLWKQLTEPVRLQATLSAAHFSSAVG
jgi:hypothetical protein